MSQPDFDRFVEGYLTGIDVLSNEKKALFFLQEPTGTSWVLTANDVLEMMVLQMRMQNIIDRFSFWNASNNDAAYRSKLFSLIYGQSAKENHDLHSSLINQAVEKLQSGDATLLEIEPVYGALVLILAKDFSLAKK